MPVNERARGDSEAPACKAPAAFEASDPVHKKKVGNLDAFPASWFPTVRESKQQAGAVLGSPANRSFAQF